MGQGRGLDHDFFTLSPVLRYEDTDIGLREGELIEFRCSRKLLDSDLESKPNWPLIEKVTPEIHAIESRQHECGQVKRFTISHPQRIMHRAFNSCKVGF